MHIGVNEALVIGNINVSGCGSRIFVREQILPTSHILSHVGEENLGNKIGGQGEIMLRKEIIIKSNQQLQYKLFFSISMPKFPLNINDQ